MTTTEGEPKSLDFCLLSIPNISVFNFFVLQNGKYLKKQASIDEMSKKKTSAETIPQNKHLMMKKKNRKNAVCHDKQRSTDDDDDRDDRE